MVAARWQRRFKFYKEILTFRPAESVCSFQDEKLPAFQAVSTIFPSG